MTKIRLCNLNQTSEAKYWSNFSFKISPELQPQSLDQTLCSKSKQKYSFMTKPQLPNLLQTVANMILIIIDDVDDSSTSATVTTSTSFELVSSHAGVCGWRWEKELNNQSVITSNNLLWIMNTFSRKPLQLFSNFCQLWATSLPVYHGKLSLLWHSSITDNNHLGCKSENLVSLKRNHKCRGYEPSILQSSTLPQISNLANIDNFKISAKKCILVAINTQSQPMTYKDTVI